MKTSKKLLLTALSATLTASLTSGLALTAFADTATQDHEFDAKNDVVFENFDRADLSDTVTANGSGVNIGEKPYLHVKYTAGTSVSPADAIYKQGSGSLANVKDGGTITLKMRAPENDVELSEIKFGIRGVDNDAAVLAKTLDELTDVDGSPLPALTSEWQTYEISFATSYEETDIYPTTSDAVTATPLLAIHIFAATATDTGTLDIASVSYSTTGSNLMNDFIGGDKVEDTAKNADSGTWWAGSSEGYIVKRAISMTGGDFTVVKETAVGDYSYAVIEADGDTANLKVATTTDGTTWGDPVAYDGYSINLNGTEKGFKFIYDGTNADGVTIRRIYLTNNVTAAPATAVPVINASSAELLEDFSVAQSGFTGVWEDMSTAPELAVAGLDYRLSYANGDKVEVKDGNLVFDATNLAADGYINFKFKSKSAAHGDFIVIKAKAEGGADLNGFRFALGNPEDAYGNVIWTNQMKAAFEYPAVLLDEKNPYKDGDWYYVVVDLEESGFGVSEAGYSGMDIYYSGTGKLSIDSIFFADEVDKVPTNCVKTILNEAGDAPFALDFVASAEGYQYGCEVKGLDGTPDFYNVLAMDIEIAEGTDLSGVRFAFGCGERWAGENAAGGLYLTDGNLLANAGFVAGQAKTVYIDLVKSDITLSNFHIHTNGTGTGSFKISNAKLLYMTNLSELKVPDGDNAFTVKNEAGDGDFSLNFVANAEGYQYGCAVTGLDNLEETYSVLALEIEIAEGTDLSGVRFAFGCGERWAGENAAGGLYLTDGTLLANAGFVAGQAKTVYIDLAKSDITLSSFHIHTNGTGTGSFKINSAKLMKYTVAPEAVAAYAEQIAKLPVVLDKVDPTVSITTATTAKADDEITVAYTAKDNVTATADLDVTVSVTKDGNAVTLNNNKFTAAEGVYTVTVTVRDANGNEASDTIQITVSAKETPAVTPPKEEKKGCRGSVEDSIVMGGAALMGICVLFAANKIIRKNKEN